MRVRQSSFTHEVKERLDFLDGVAFNTGANAPTHDAVEVDEEFRAQHTVDLFFPRRVTTHQTLERRRLVRCIMIDVKACESLPPLL